jgi:hypothetical protein
MVLFHWTIPIRLVEQPGPWDLHNLDDPDRALTGGSPGLTGRLPTMRRTVVAALSAMAGWLSWSRRSRERRTGCKDSWRSWVRDQRILSWSHVAVTGRWRAPDDDELQAWSLTLIRWGIGPFEGSGGCRGSKEEGINNKGVCLLRYGVDVNHHPVGNPKRKVLWAQHQIFPQ